MKVWKVCLDYSEPFPNPTTIKVHTIFRNKYLDVIVISKLNMIWKYSPKLFNVDNGREEKTRKNARFLELFNLYHCVWMLNRMLSYLEKVKRTKILPEIERENLNEKSWPAPLLFIRKQWNIVDWQKLFFWGFLPSVARYSPMGVYCTGCPRKDAPLFRGASAPSIFVILWPQKTKVHFFLGHPA